VVVLKEGRAREPDERGIGQSEPHIAREPSGLGPVRLVRHDDDVVAIAVRLCHRLIELVDQAEDVSVIFTKDLFEIRTRTGTRHLLIRYAATDERTPDLVVQILAVGHHHESEVAGDYPPHLLGEERHGVGLAAALRMPEYPETPQVGMRPFYQRQRLNLLMRNDIGMTACENFNGPIGCD